MSLWNVLSMITYAFAHIQVFANIYFDKELLIQQLKMETR